MIDLKDLRVAILATDGFEEAELVEPEACLRDAGAIVEIISNRAGDVQAFQHHDKTIKILASRTIENVTSRDYDALMLPGGALNADQLRADPQVLQFVREMHSAQKPIAAICHAPWILISAGLVRGMTLTSYPTIKDDIINAGGKWVDREVIQDRNWVTSRKPADIPAFNREMLQLFSGADHSVVRIAESA